MDSMKITINYGNYALNDIQHEMRKSFAYGLFSFLNTIKFCINLKISRLYRLYCDEKKPAWN